MKFEKSRWTKYKCTFSLDSTDLKSYFMKWSQNKYDRGKKIIYF